jgi:Uncharacterized protein conserved in bacteria (DUF2155)
MTLCRGLMLLPILALAAACNQSGDDETALAPAKSGKAQATSDKIVVADGEVIGTPMAERVAVLGLLRACEKTAPWETYPDEGAFVQLLVNERPAGTTDAERWRSVFSGWLFKENPAANVVEHPIYDVWVKACKMSFPGEEEEAAAAEGETAPAANAPSKAPQTPAPAAPADDVGEGDETTEA